MRLTPEEARARLVAHDHGVLSTLHETRGVDSVPAVYAVVDEYLAIPVDRVKPKASTRLQRARNLEADPHELRNLLRDGEPEPARRLADGLRAHLEALPRHVEGGVPVDLDAETRAELRALGYAP